MIDIKVLRSNPEIVRQSLKNRNFSNLNIVDEILQIDDSRRKLMMECENMKSEQNAFNKKIPALKKSGEDISEVMANLKNLSDEISKKIKELGVLENRQRDLILSVPNIPHSTTVVGKDESENVEIRRFGEPRQFDFEVQAHWDIGKNLDILDPERAAKVTGTRFHFYKGAGARLERSLMNFFLDTHTENGYTEILPPFIANGDSLLGTGQFPKFKEDEFKLENLDYYLVPTAEVPVTNFHRGEILNGNDLPVKYCAYSACFRSETSSGGRDTRGLIRQHQFNKVELVWLCNPENSYGELERIANDAEKLLQLLELPYRVVCICTGDLGFCSAKTYDIEVWMPSYNRYVEISSCSNFEDYQSRRMGIRYKNDIKDKAKLVHTLNGSGLAIGRTVAAILENYQNLDGTVSIPDVLQKYMGTDTIK